MFDRILTIALNTYREAVRARLLVGVFVLAIATSTYALVVAAMSLHNELRVVADLGAAAGSLYAVAIAIILGSTSLHRELELKTIFPILSRPVRRWEYLVGKYFGTLLSVLVFLTLHAALVLAFLTIESSNSPGTLGGAVVALLAILVPLLLRARHTREFVLVPWAVAAFVTVYLLAGSAGAERQLVLASVVLSFFEVVIVAGIAALFASFSSPALTAVFTVLLWIIGRSSDTMAHVPKKVFGEGVAAAFKGLSHVVPNLHVYVPARTLLLGQSHDVAVWPYVAEAALHATLYATVLLAGSVLIFRKRDFA